MIFEERRDLISRQAFPLHNGRTAAAEYIQCFKASYPYCPVSGGENGIDFRRTQTFASRETGDPDVAKVIDPPRCHYPQVSFTILEEPPHPIAGKTICGPKVLY